MGILRVINFMDYYTASIWLFFAWRSKEMLWNCKVHSIESFLLLQKTWNPPKTLPSPYKPPSTGGLPDIPWGFTKTLSTLEYEYSPVAGHILSCSNFNTKHLVTHKKEPQKQHRSIKLISFTGSKQQREKQTR